MGNKQSIRQHAQTQSKGGDDDARDNNNFTPPSNTLTSLKGNKTKGYSFSIPKNTCWGEDKESCVGGDIEFGDRKFVPVDSTRCLLTNKGRTEAILIRNYKTQTIHVCSFTPPGNEVGNGHPLFEWGVVGKSNNRTRCNGYTMTTPFNGSYSVRGVVASSSTSSSELTSTSSNQQNIINNNNKMVVTTLNNNGENKTCATFEETDDTWECHTMHGIDPAMMVCFIVSLDTLRTMKKQRSGSIISLGSARSRIRRSCSGSSSMNRTTRTTSLLTSTSLSSNNSSGRSATKNNATGLRSKSTSSSKMLEKSYSSKRNSIGSCSQDMPSITSFINARAA